MAKYTVIVRRTTTEQVVAVVEAESWERAWEKVDNGDCDAELVPAKGSTKATDYDLVLVELH